MAEMIYDSLKIVLIDDDVYIRKLISKLLQRLGIQSIYEAGDGKSGFMEVVRTRPDLVLCDINMESPAGDGAPTDGLTFLARLRHCSIGTVKETPVIFLTGDSNEATVVQAKRLGVNGYLVKPVSLTDLKRRIDGVLTTSLDDIMGGMFEE